MKNRPPYYHVLFPSPFGELCIVWKESSVLSEHSDPKVVRLFLPREGISSVDNLIGRFSASLRESCRPIESLIAAIQEHLAGDPAPLSLELLDFSRCSPFQRTVLLEEYTIPYGKVSTYGELARKTGSPESSRAAGTALARNPFPVIIPCHRVVRSNGEPGGYQGGTDMKRRFLEREGILFSENGKVLNLKYRMYNSCKKVTNFNTANTAKPPV